MPLVASIALIAVLSGGLFLALRSREPGWLGLPFAIVAVRMLQQGGISPLLSDPTRFDAPSIYAVALRSVEVPRAVGLLLLSYASVAAGMLLVCLLRGARGPDRVVARAFKVDLTQARKWSWIIFLVGLGAQLIVFYMLGGVGAVRSIASERAVFTDAEAADNPIYGNARLISTWMLVGALGLVLFARPNSDQRKVGIVCCLAYALFYVAYGSRSSTALVFLALALTLHHGVHRIPRRIWFALGSAAVFLIAVLMMLRQGYTSIHESGGRFVQKVATDRAVVEVGSILRLCPDRVPFQSGATFLAPLPTAVPGLNVPSATNLYTVVATETMGSAWLKNRRVGGGETFSLAAESYVNFGNPGVVLVPLVMGILFGLLFERQRLRPQDPFLVLLTVGIWTAFFGAIDAKPTFPICAIPLQHVIPLAIIAVMSVPGCRWRREFIAFLYCAVGSYVVWRFSGIPALKVVTSTLIVTLYTLGFALLELGPVQTVPRRFGVSGRRNNGAMESASP